MNQKSLRKRICAIYAIYILFSMNILQAQNIVTTEVNADSSITFRLNAPNAKKVKVMSDCLVPRPDNSWFGGKMHKTKMKKDEDGIWTYTTRQLKPELYNYRFIVDGDFIEDPTNKDSTYVLLHKESVIAVGGSERADLYIERPNNPYRGHIDTLEYFNEQQELTRKILVYVPHTDTILNAMPIVYLLHGISGDEASWIEAGRVNHILDNLIADSIIQPMLVVMPDCNVPQKLNPKQRTNIFRNIFNYPALQQGHFEEAFPGLHELICHTYPVAQDHFFHAIAGLSSGAKQAANIVRDNSDIFAIVGLFSPVGGKEQLPHDDNMHYEIFVGKYDFFYKTGVNFAERLLKAGISTRLHESQSAHTWVSWREYVSQFFIIINQIWNLQPIPHNDATQHILDSITLEQMEQVLQTTDSIH